VSLHRLRVLGACIGVAVLASALLTQGAAPSPIVTTAATATPGVQIKPITFGLAPQPSTRKPVTENTELYDYVNPCGLVPLPEVREITDQGMLYYSVKNGESLTANVNDAQVWSSRQHRRLTCNLTSGINSGLPVDISCQLRMSASEFWERYRTENSDSIPDRTARKVRLAIPGINDAYVGYEHERPWRLIARTKYGTELAITGPEDIDVLTGLMRAAASTIDGSRYGYDK